MDSDEALVVKEYAAEHAGQLVRVSWLGKEFSGVIVGYSRHRTREEWYVLVETPGRSGTHKGFKGLFLNIYLAPFTNEDEVGGWFVDSLTLTQDKRQVVKSYPHKCRHCGGPALQLFTSTDCKARCPGSR